MPKLFVFAIGGTGSRVLKSLSMLLAAGIKPVGGVQYEVVPIIIDPHKSNDDLKRTTRLLENYQAITDKIGLDNGFFSTGITTFDRLRPDGSPSTGSTFTFGLQEVANTKFKEYISYNSLNVPTRALANVLFSGKSVDKRGGSTSLLDVEMDIGFVGNPNIGSVVLNQFKDSNEFADFASVFNDEDRIFIISSIFGGTGAAGFPIVLKNIRNALNNRNVNSGGFLRDAKIGAISVLPYFNIAVSEDSPIQKSHFISKAKSALHYYKDNITGNNSINCLYYIADDYNGSAYPNDPGDNGQQNDAHFVEMAAALSLIDFMEIPDERLETFNGTAATPIYKEFALKNDALEIKFSDFEDETERKLCLRLSQLTLFNKYINERLRTSIGTGPWCLKAPQIDSALLDDAFYRVNLKEFLDSFDGWLREMSLNKRSFAPFNLDSAIQTFIKDRAGAKGMLGFGGVDYPHVDDELNSHAKEDFPNAQVKFVKLFFKATQKVLTEKFNIQQ